MKNKLKFDGKSEVVQTWEGILHVANIIQTPRSVYPSVYGYYNVTGYHIYLPPYKPDYAYLAIWLLEHRHERVFLHYTLADINSPNYIGR